jgi:hypothetical protein
MDNILNTAADKFSVQLMPYFSLYKYNDTLIHAVTDNGTLARFPGLVYVTHSLQSSG